MAMIPPDWCGRAPLRGFAAVEPLSGRKRSRPLTPPDGAPVRTSGPKVDPLGSFLSGMAFAEASSRRLLLRFARLGL